MGKLSNEEKEQWKELFSYIEKEIFNYDDNQKLQKNAVLRLRGLSQGQVIANSKCEKHGSYSPEVILITFKMQKNKIVNAIKDKDFESEDHKMAYVCAIIRDKLNNVYERIQTIKRSQQQEEQIDTSIMEHKGVEYKKKTTKDVSKKIHKINHEELW